MSDTEDNRRSVELSGGDTPASSSEGPVASSSLKDVVVRVEIGGKEEDPKDSDEKQDAEKSLMEGEAPPHHHPPQDEEIAFEGVTEGKDVKDTPTLPLPPYKSKRSSSNADVDKPAKKPSIFTAPVARIRHEWSVSSGLVEFFTKTTVILFASIGWVVIIGGAPLLSIVQLIIGAVYNGQCPAEPRIPEYLIVSGFFGTILHVVTYCTKYYSSKKESDFVITQRRRCFCLELLLQIFLFIWFLAGCAWVYSIYEPDYEFANKDDYCHKTLYLFTFWIFNITFMMIALFIVIGISCCACIAISSDKKEAPSEA